MKTIIVKWEENPSSWGKQCKDVLTHIPDEEVEEIADVYRNHKFVKSVEIKDENH